MDVSLQQLRSLVNDSPYSQRCARHNLKAITFLLIKNIQWMLSVQRTIHQSIWHLMEHFMNMTYSIYTHTLNTYVHLRHSALSEQLPTVCLQEGSMFPLEKYRGNGAFDNVRWNLENGIVICNWSVECCWIAFKKARAQCGIETVKWYVPCLETSTNCRQQDFLSSSVRLHILLWHNPRDD